MLTSVTGVDLSTAEYLTIGQWMDI